MKIMLACFALLFTFNSKAQECDLVTLNVDKFTKETKYKADPVIVDGNDDGGIMFSITNFGNSKFFAIVAVDASCVDEGDEAIFLFDDGTSASYFNGSDFNCKGIYLIKLGGMTVGSPNVKCLWEKRITAIRLRPMSDVFEFEIPEESGTQIKDILACFMSKGKKK